MPEEQCTHTIMPMPAHTLTRHAMATSRDTSFTALNDFIPKTHTTAGAPCRYRTQLCRDGQACRRKVCFFAHAVHELRVPEEAQQVQGPPTQCQTTDAGHGMSSVGPTSGPPPDLAAAASQLAGMALSQPSSSLQAAAAGERAAALDTLSVEQQVQVMLMLQHARKQEEEREQQAAQAALLQSYTLQQLQRSSQQAQVASSKAMVEASQAQAPGYYDPASTRLAMPATYTVGNLPPPATSCPSYPNTMPARAAMLAPPVAPPVRGSAPLLEPMTYPVPVVPAPTAAFRPLEVAYRAAASQPAAAGLSSLLPRQQGLNMPSSGMAALQLQQLQHSPSDLGAHQQLIQGGWCQDLLPTSAAFGPKSSSSGCSGLSSGFSQLAGIGSTTGSNTELPAGAALGCYSSYASSSCSGDLLASPVHAGQQREGMLRLQGLKLQTSVGSAQKQGAGSSQGQPWLLYGPADNTMWLQ